MIVLLFSFFIWELTTGVVSAQAHACVVRFRYFAVAACILFLVFSYHKRTQMTEQQMSFARWEDQTRPHEPHNRLAVQVIKAYLLSEQADIDASAAKVLLGTHRCLRTEPIITDGSAPNSPVFWCCRGQSLL
jgi:hypothetical protein